MWIVIGIVAVLIIVVALIKYECLEIADFLGDVVELFVDLFVNLFSHH